MSPLDITPKERLNKTPNLMDRIIDKDHVTFEGKYISKQEKVIPFEFNAILMNLNGKKVILSIGRNITERQRLENELKASEKRYRNLVEHAPDGIAIHQGGVFNYVNPAGAKILGAIHSEQLIDKNILDFILPEYHDIIKERWKEMRETKEPSLPLEENMIRLSGFLLWCQVKIV